MSSTTLSSHQNTNKLFVHIAHLDRISGGKHSAIINSMVSNCLVSSAGSRASHTAALAPAPPHSEYGPEWRGRIVPQPCDPINISEQVLVNSILPVI